MSLPNIGFIGIGLMGEAMTLRLLDLGYPVFVWNREPERLASVAAAGAIPLASPAQVARQCDVVLMCVLDDAAVDSCTRGAQGIAQAGAGTGKLVIDFSTISPRTTRELAAHALQHTGMHWMDAPVSGGPQAAREGQLTIMVGGSAEDFERARPVLQALGSQVTLMGPAGAGQTAKIINQAIVGAGFVLMSEAALLAEASGIDAAQLPACLQGGFADSVLLQKVYPRIHERRFDPPIGYARQLSKDMDAVQAFAHEADCDLPMVQQAARLFARYVEGGAAMADSASIIRLYEMGQAGRQGRSEGEGA
ncbi:MULTISPECIES: NAD(P)-dependent oxidoreductase [Comamonas]|uniref:NAD(P)-dependent oxidoreductase n=1 Tax=Comamonas TaxID=283 RepID=UPI0001BB1863|nr:MULTISPECIES: NAD(P)-dependent oxidoreductase [Comamonas]ACY33832.1 2-hydroxy-3-oxopropionate reductase [Comamonas thiooxydans]MBL5979943.1 NAD(P)-dependent oxidoreductase [Comamonas sp. NyZ500]MDO1475805.1 NAD(P)-dependent oxidoreductase [Comamonas thiooxydans]